MHWTEARNLDCAVPFDKRDRVCSAAVLSAHVKGAALTCARRLLGAPGD